jgi:hypothetical protein
MPRRAILEVIPRRRSARRQRRWSYPLSPWSLAGRLRGCPGRPRGPLTGATASTITWFRGADAMNAALACPEMGVAVDDAKNFLDMERTGLIIVDERTILG